MQQELDNQEQKEIETQIKDSNIKRVLDDVKFQFKFDSGYSGTFFKMYKNGEIQYSLRWDKNLLKFVFEYFRICVI